MAVQYRSHFSSSSTSSSSPILFGWMRLCSGPSCRIHRPLSRRLSLCLVTTTAIGFWISNSSPSLSPTYYVDTRYLSIYFPIDQYAYLQYLHTYIYIPTHLFTLPTYLLHLPVIIHRIVQRYSSLRFSLLTRRLFREDG
ncbi:hypothetical protein GGR55DRAFT_497409 [Xylaria sp. FL0064]|nr:hypothetical protein GGR55DRAFT_497409 [Xylaria sp. FL0064]